MPCPVKWPLRRSVFFLPGTRTSNPSGNSVCMMLQTIALKMEMKLHIIVRVGDNIPRNNDTFVKTDLILDSWWPIPRWYILRYIFGDETGSKSERKGFLGGRNVELLVELLQCCESKDRSDSRHIRERKASLRPYVISELFSKIVQACC